MGLNRTVAAIFGVVYVLAGVAGFILTSPLFGLFETSVLHNIAHIVLGAILLWGAMDTVNATLANRGVGIVLLVLGVLGFIVGNSLNFLPLGGNDIWLHLVSGAILTIVGFMGARTMATA